MEYILQRGRYLVVASRETFYTDDEPRFAMNYVCSKTFSSSFPYIVLLGIQFRIGREEGMREHTHHF